MTKILIMTLLTACGFSVYAEKPNILFIMADDHCAQAVGVYNSRLAKLNPTPTIDAIANDGVVMDRAFCTNAICAPSRAGIIG